MARAGGRQASATAYPLKVLLGEAPASQRLGEQVGGGDMHHSHGSNPMIPTSMKP